MSDCLERIRIVILGGPEIGKSAIIKRFLLKTFSEKYRRTVEDLYSREFRLNSADSNSSDPTLTIKVDILDTAGDMQFPAMRRLCIANANAFLLVYSITSLNSFTYLKNAFEEIREQRADFHDIPMVIVGNKHDLSDRREVSIDIVSEWILSEFQSNRVKLMECSAKENYNIKEIFRSFLLLSPFWSEKNNVSKLSNEDINKWKRRSSSYLSCISVDSKNSENRRIKSVEKCVSTTTTTNVNTETVSKSKPRSRSLIRRSSQKTKQLQNNSADECNLS